MSDTPSQLDTKLAALVDTIISATKAAGDLAMEQLPDLAMQMVMYGRAYHTVLILISILLCLFAVYCFRRVDTRDDGTVPHAVGAMLAIVVGGIIFISNINNFMLSWFAPKVYIIKEVASLLK